MSKTILITGASTGFGKLTAKTLALKGYNVVATMRGVDTKNSSVANELKAWADKDQVKLDVVELDVTSDESVSTAAALIHKKYDAVDVVVNNAGVYKGGVTESFSVADFKEMYEVNVFGSLRVVQAFLPTMRKRQDGLFIQVSSVMGRFVIPFFSAYTSSKWAVEAIAESLRYELAPLGVDSVVIQPGGFQTEIFQKVTPPSNANVLSEYGRTTDLVKNFNEAFSKMMSGEIPNKPQQVADAVVKLIETPVGKRPLRVTVDRILEGLAESINEAQGKVQDTLLANFGLAEVSQTQGQLVQH